MNVNVRPMELHEVDMVIDYFLQASAEHHETLGVDPTRLPPRDVWRNLLDHELRKPIEQRRSYLVLWECEGKPVGFSSVDKIKYGAEAYMHLHIVESDLRRRGVGAACVAQSAAHYFDVLRLQRLYCEPNAYNVAPNRTLQKAGFRYVKTHKTVPGPLNFHQAVTRWIMERDAVMPSS